MRAARRRSCLLRSTNNSWAAYVFAVPLPVRGRHRPKAGWLVSYSPGNSSAYAMSIVRTRRKRLSARSPGGRKATPPRRSRERWHPISTREVPAGQINRAAWTGETARHIWQSRTWLIDASEEFCTGDKRKSRVTAARGESAANPLPTDPAVNCVEPQRPRRLIETDPRRGQVFRGGEGQPYWAVMRGGFMASGRVRCRRR